MRALPPSLAAWSRLRELLPAPLAEALGAMVRQLSPLVGPLQTSGRHRDDLDGYSGVAPRGPLHRLLPSEWLLAAEIPDEFIRRAALGEQLFFDRVRKQSTRGLQCLALVDGGPAQFGSPRIGQLALLTLLAGRAESARASFRWGTLQDRNHASCEGFGEQSVVESFLRGRSFDPAAPAHLDAWSTALGGWERFDEIWLIGDVRRLALPRALAVQIDDILEPGPASLHIAVRGGASLTLRLPESDDACTKLLRDPFEKPPAELLQLPRARKFNSNPIVDPSGGRIYIRAAPDQLWVYDTQKRGRPRNWGSRLDVITGIGRQGSARVLTGCQGESLAYHSMGTNDLTRFSSRTFIRPLDLQPVYFFEGCPLVIDGHRSLFATAHLEAKLIATNVLASQQFDGNVTVILGCQPGEHHLSLITLGGTQGNRRNPLTTELANQACLGECEAFAWRDGRGWHMPNSEFIAPPLDGVGLTTVLLLLSEDRRRLLAYPGGAEWHNFSSPVVSHHFAAGPAVGAFLCEDGQLLAIHAKRQHQRVLILEG